MEKDLKQQLKELYAICFPEDTESYTDFFLNNKFDGTNCMTVFDGGTLVNMLFLVKKKMVIRGTVFDIPYMTAGGTRPEYRGKGIFSKVLLEAMENFQRAGNRPVTGLMPSAHDFYVRHSFVTHSFYDEIPLSKGRLPLTEISFDAIPQMKNIYDNFTRGKSGWFFRDEAAFNFRLREIFNEGGKAYGLFEKGKLNGYILAFSDDYIDEYCAVENNYIEKFDTPFDAYWINTGSLGTEDNMIRICDNAALMNMIRYGADLNCGVTFEVVDRFHKKNSGKYSLTVKNGKGIVQPAEKAEFVLTIEEFTKLIMGCYQTGEFPQKLEQIFPVVLNCALEKF